MKLTHLLAIGALLATPAIAQHVYDLSPEQPGRIHTQKDDAIAAQLPADFKFAQDGTLTVAVAVGGEPPIGTYATDAATVIGADPDIASLVAEKLGLKLSLVSVAWPDWPLGLASGKYDAVVSNVGVTEERKLKFDFSTYRQGLHGFFVKSDSPITAIAEPKDVAGLKVATSSGTIQDRIINEWSNQNVAAGLAASEILYYDDSPSALLALQSGRVDAIFNVNSVYGYQAKKTGALRLVGNVNAGWPNIADVGIVTRKDSGLADPLTAAINALIAEGTYKPTLEKWDLWPEHIDTSRTNPPGLPKY